MDSPRPDISVVLPSCSDDNVVEVTRRLTDALSILATWEIVFVNNASPDGTLNEIKRLAAADSRIRFISFTRHFGLPAALRAGLAHARGAAVILFDCDFEPPVELVPKLVQEWRRGAKVVVTQRETAPIGDSYLKRVTLLGFYRLLNVLPGVHIDPGSTDFILLDRAAVDAISRFESHDLLLRALVRWLGFPVVQLSYSPIARRADKSRFRLRHMVHLAATGIVTHSIKPLRIAIHLSIGFATLGVLLLIYSIGSFIWLPQYVVAGWTSILAALAILGAGQFLVLGIIGEYIGRILHETRRWPVYLVAETEADARPSLADRVPLSPESGTAPDGSASHQRDPTNRRSKTA